MRRIIIYITIAVMTAGLFVPAHAEEIQAENISTSTAISGSNWDNYWILTDGLEAESMYVGDGLTLENPRGIGALYLVFDYPCDFLVQDLDTEKTITEQKQGYLHVFSDLEGKFGYVPKRISLQFPSGAWLAEVQVYSSGEVPDSVQRWQTPLTGGADIVLFSTHGDDEQLYFAGMLPYYSVERDLDVQVVYMTSHENLDGSIRQHEMLNGLWAVGVRAYPVFGPFPDFKIMDRDGTYEEYENLGYSRNALLSFVVESIRRFRPLVAVGHDLNGEYGHGMHMVYSDLLTKAVEISADSEAFPGSAAQYGVWDVPKTYLHLYWENPIVMDWDQPLESFDGMTAFEVTQKLGFPCHISQQYDLYTGWLYGGGTITQASQIKQWNPCCFGLYRTTVGEDVQKNDFMENLLSYGDIARRNEEQDRKLRSTVELAQAQQAVEPKLLRNPEEPKPIEAPEQRIFPVFSALTAMVTAAGAGYLLINKKYFEKKQK